MKRFKRKLETIIKQFKEGVIDFDVVYDFLEGWIAYSKNSNSYNYRIREINKIKDLFNSEISAKEYDKLIKSHKKIII